MGTPTPTRSTTSSKITIAFAGPAKIDQFTVSKLFFEGNPLYNEVGAYSLDGGGTFTQFVAELESPGSDTPGDLVVS